MIDFVSFWVADHKRKSPRCPKFNCQGQRIAEKRDQKSYQLTVLPEADRGLFFISE
jgi:hypothetical protein